MSSPPAQHPPATSHLHHQRRPSPATPTPGHRPISRLLPKAPMHSIQELTRSFADEAVKTPAMNTWKVDEIKYVRQRAFWGHGFLVFRLRGSFDSTAGFIRIERTMSSAWGILPGNDVPADDLGRWSRKQEDVVPDIALLELVDVISFRQGGPSAYEVFATALAVHRVCATYSLLGTNCLWMASIIFHLMGSKPGAEVAKGKKAGWFTTCLIGWTGYTKYLTVVDLDGGRQGIAKITGQAQADAEAQNAVARLATLEQLHEKHVEWLRKKHLCQVETLQKEIDKLRPSREEERERHEAELALYGGHNAAQVSELRGEVARLGRHLMISLLGEL
ncbi:hypothetical protein B0H14DRAFT_2596738 [Mycena olivaceomarginata]|nr:hypothetical protein B0H14DRAFT_2596738 [Mycena olivaceomarginata]